MPRNYLSNPALGRWVKWQRYNRTLLDRGESSVLDKRRIKLLNAIDFSWGYQRVPPKKQNHAATEQNQPVPYIPVENSTSRNYKIALRANASHSVRPVLERSNPSISSFDASYSEPMQYDIDAHRSVENSPNTMSSEFDDANLNYFGKRNNSANVGIDDFSHVNSTTVEFKPIKGRYAENIENALFFFNPFDCPNTEYSSSLEIWSNQNSHTKRGYRWKCSICRLTAFKTHDEALAHESRCKGFTGENFFLFCQACSC